MLLFHDGFDHYATADLLVNKWTSGLLSQFGQDAITVATVGRSGSKGLRFSWVNVNSRIYIQRTLAPSGSTFIIGISGKLANISSSSSNNTLLSVWDGGTIQSCLRVNADSTLSVLRGNFSGTVLGTSAAAISLATEQYLEWKVTLHGSTGSYAVRLNRSTILSGSGVNTANAGTTAWTAVRLGSDGVNNNVFGTTWDFDDLYVCDGSGSLNNDFLGDCRSISRIAVPDATAAGTYATLTPSTGTDHGALVDDSTPNSTDYNGSATVGAKDTYRLPALGVTGTVLGVQSLLYAFKSDGGARTIQRLLRQGGADYTGPSVDPGTTPAYVREILETNPATSAAWTVTDLNAAGHELGMLVDS